MTPEQMRARIDTLERQVGMAGRANRMKKVLTLMELECREARQRMCLAERAHEIAAQSRVVTPEQVRAIAEGNAGPDPKFIAATHDHMASAKLQALGDLCLEMCLMLGLLTSEPEADRLKLAE